MSYAVASSVIPGAAPAAASGAAVPGGSATGSLFGTTTQSTSAGDAGLLAFASDDDFGQALATSLGQTTTTGAFGVPGATATSNGASAVFLPGLTPHPAATLTANRITPWNATETTLQGAQQTASGATQTDLLGALVAADPGLAASPQDTDDDDASTSVPAGAKKTAIDSTASGVAAAQAANVAAQISPIVLPAASTPALTAGSSSVSAPVQPAPTLVSPTDAAANAPAPGNGLDLSKLGFTLSGPVPAPLAKSAPAPQSASAQAPATAAQAQSQAVQAQTTVPSAVSGLTAITARSTDNDQVDDASPADTAAAVQTAAATATTPLAGKPAIASKTENKAGAGSAAATDTALSDSLTGPSPMAVAANGERALQATGQNNASSSDGKSDDKSSSDDGPPAQTADASADTASAPVIATQAALAANEITTPGGLAASHGTAIVSQIAAQIAGKGVGKTSSFDIALDPAGLGRVDVQVRIDAAGQVSASMSFNNAQSAAAAQTHAADLRQALEQAGFNIAQNGLSFAVGGQGAGFARQDSQPQHTQAAFSQTQAAADSALDNLSAMSSRGAGRSLSGLDITI